MNGPLHSENYVAAAIAGEIDKVTNAPNGTRNIELFRASSALASLNCANSQIITALKLAANECGLSRDDGPLAVLNTIRSGIRAGRSAPRPPTNRHERRRAAAIQRSVVATATNVVAPPLKVDPIEPPKTFPELPLRTPADEHGKPKFFIGDDDGPRRDASEIRRHVYRRDGMPVRIKIKFRVGSNSRFGELVSCLQCGGCRRMAGGEARHYFGTCLQFIGPKASGK